MNKLRKKTLKVATEVTDNCNRFTCDHLVCIWTKDGKRQPSLSGTASNHSFCKIRVGDLKIYDPIKMHHTSIYTDGMCRPNFGRIHIIYFHLISYPSMFVPDMATNAFIQPIALYKCTLDSMSNKVNILQLKSLYRWYSQLWVIWK